MNGQRPLDFPTMIPDRPAELRASRRRRTATERAVGKIGCAIVGLCLVTIYTATTVGYYGMHVGMAVLLGLIVISAVFCFLAAAGV